MADEPENLTLALLREIRAEMREGFAEMKGELAGVREALAEARARAQAAEARAEAAETRIENLLAELTDRGAQHADERAVLLAQVASERANAEKAIQAFGSLADRLDALAAAQRQPFLKRLTKIEAGRRP